MKLRRTHGAVELLFVLALKVSVICATGTGSDKVSVTEGQDAVLNCSFSPKLDLRGKTFDWTRNNGVSGELQEVFYFSGGFLHNAAQDPSLKGRVSHFPEELENGNASIRINQTRLSDGGNYTCIFPYLRQTSTVELVVEGIMKDRSGEMEGAPGKPSVTSVHATKSWSKLQCIVEGASPKPVVRWQNSVGELVPAEEQVSLREDHYDIILLTTVTKTDLYSCVVTQQEILHQTHASISVFISGSVKVSVTEGQDAVLNCSPSPKLDLRGKTFDWKRNNSVSGKLQEVFFFSGGRLHNNAQDPSLKGRVSHFPEELENGNASIKISQTRLSDGGNYTCIFPRLRPRQTFTVELVVGAPGKPSICMFSESKSRSKLQCIVEGASPKPVVRWQNSVGELVPAEEQVSLREDHYDIILLTTVTKTDNYSCVVTQQEILHQTHASISVFISEDCSGKVDAGWRIAAVIGAVILAAVQALLHCRNYITIKLKKGSDKVSVTEGQDAVLNCSSRPKRNLRGKTFYWWRNNGVSGEHQEVFYCKGGFLQNDAQDPSLKGRVSHFPEELENGNASIKISQTRLSDGGNYTCIFPRLRPRQTFTVELVVAPEQTDCPQEEPRTKVSPTNPEKIPLNGL